MRCRSAGSLIAIALASCGASPARSSSTGAAGTCPAAHARTIAASSNARVYSVSGIVYGCSGRTHKVTRLGRSDTCLRAKQVGPVKVAGDLAAYGVRSCGVDTGSGDVLVRRLSDGKLLRRDPAVSGALGPESYSSVGAIVLKDDGSVAWIGVGSSIVSHGRRLEVHKVDRAGAEVLDSGPAIRAGSLRLHHSRLTWKHGGRTRAATLG